MRHMEPAYEAFHDGDIGVLTDRINSALWKNFEGLYVADMNRNLMKIIKGTGGFAQYEGKVIPQRETMLMFARNMTGEDQAYFRDVCGNPEKVQEILAKDPDTEYLYQSPNYGGESVWMKCEIHTLTWQDGIPATAMVGISVVDTIQRERLELSRKYKEQQKSLREALVLAQSANRAKTTFLNNMSHDIRTPMNAIIGYTALAASHIDNTDRVRDYLTKINHSSNHLLSLINDVLDMSRIESGKVSIEERPEDLSEIMHGLRDMVQSDICAKNQDFFIDSIDVRDEGILCDRLRLNQVLLNVLSNAIKYTPSGGTVSMQVIQSAPKPNGYAAYRFVIKDNGIGMSADFLETIFDPFTRARDTTASGVQGTGLGMAITRNIVDLMGGTIAITSELNRGTEVTLDFDFRLSEENKASRQIPELENTRALVVDDDINTCSSVSRMLKDIGMRSEWCTSGREAVIRARLAVEEAEPFRVFLLDWLMPDMNGLETARQIRRAMGSEVPIIVLSAYDWSDIEEEALAAGVTAFVSKPIFLSDIYGALEKCLGKTETAAEEPTPRFAGRRALLVEDNEFNREIARELLEERGLMVEEAEDGDSAVAEIQRLLDMGRPTHYDFVLMDIQMPRMNGYEAAAAIRELLDPVGIHIPIIAMTANAFEEDRRLALAAGMDDHLAKPIDVSALWEALAPYL